MWECECVWMSVFVCCVKVWEIVCVRDCDENVWVLWESGYECVFVRDWECVRVCERLYVWDSASVRERELG